jgi:hypothetical protein
MIELRIAKDTIDITNVFRVGGKGQSVWPTFPAKWREICLLGF